jgi:hypothetical protein
MRTPTLIRALALVAGCLVGGVFSTGCQPHAATPAAPIHHRRIGVPRAQVQPPPMQIENVDWVQNG